MRVTIPFDLDTGKFLEVDIEYCVIATGGPPEPPFNVRIVNWQFSSCWQIDLNSEVGISESDVEVNEFDNMLNYCDTDDCNIKTPYDDYIRSHLEEIKQACLNFELTQADSML